MLKGSSSLYVPSLRKTVCALLLVTASLLLASDMRIIVNAQSVDVDALKIRVIGVTKGLNAANLLINDTNTTSYQSKAFLQLARQEHVDGFTDAKIAQYYALYCIFYATNAVANEITESDDRFENITMPEWVETTNWKIVNVDPCGNTMIDTVDNTTGTSIATTLSTMTTDGWKGVTCDAEGRVVTLEFYDNFLTGTWPEETVLLAYDGPFSTGAGALELLDLYDNEFLSNGGDSSWMSDLGSNMSKLQQIMHIAVSLP